MAIRDAKLKQMLSLSDEILGNLEEEDISFGKTLLKCKKLARMRNDFEAMNWFSLELHGYDENDLPFGVRKEDLWKFVQLSGRTTILSDPSTQKDELKYWTSSVPDLEARFQSLQTALQNLKPPSEFSPAINKTSYTNIYTGPTTRETVVEKYQDVLNAVDTKRKTFSEGMALNRGILSKIRNNVYNYVLGINLQLRFENVTESFFQKTKELVDKELSRICPETMKKFVAAYERLQSSNPEEWSQSLSTCRNILKDFADVVFPAQKEPYICRNGETLIVTEDKYKNRLLAFIDRESQGNKRKLLSSRMSDLFSRIHDLNDLLSQGAHEGLELIDVNICIIDTYLLIGSLLSSAKK